GGLERRGEERAAGDRMQRPVREQEAGVERGRLPLQMFTELSQSCAAVENEKLPPATDLEARGIAAIGRPGRTGTSDATAHAPEADKKIAVFRHQWLPADQAKRRRLER